MIRKSILIVSKLKLQGKMLSDLQAREVPFIRSHISGLAPFILSFRLFQLASENNVNDPGLKLILNFSKQREWTSQINAHLVTHYWHAALN